MRRWKLLAAAAFLGFGVLAAGAYLTGIFSPSVDPALDEKLVVATSEEINPLIRNEAERLEVSALGVFIKEGDSPGRMLHFGRSKEGALMQAASLSKAVAAAVVLILADREGVGLDEDIRPQIASLDIASLEGGNRPVTLRQLLSHTTGASQSGYAGFPRGVELPSTAEVILGSRRTFEFELAFDGEPGKFRYSGGGYTVAQLWAEDVSGKGFDGLADELLLMPLGMKSSTFVQPIEEMENPPTLIVGADAGFNPIKGVFSALEDSWHNYPEKAAAGLWTVPEDYARFVAALLDAAAGENNTIPPQVANAMLSAHADTGWETGPQRYGLGVMLEFADDGGLRSVSHTGGNAGYRSYFIARPATDNVPQKILVSMGNTQSAAPLSTAILHGLLER